MSETYLKDLQRELESTEADFEKRNQGLEVIELTPKAEIKKIFRGNSNESLIQNRSDVFTLNNEEYFINIDNLALGDILGQANSSQSNPKSDSGEDPASIPFSDQAPEEAPNEYFSYGNQVVGAPGNKMPSPDFCKKVITPSSFKPAQVSSLTFEEGRILFTENASAEQPSKVKVKPELKSKFSMSNKEFIKAREEAKERLSNTNINPQSHESINIDSSGRFFKSNKGVESGDLVKDEIIKNINIDSYNLSHSQSNISGSHGTRTPVSTEANLVDPAEESLDLEAVVFDYLIDLKKELIAKFLIEKEIKESKSEELGFTNEMGILQKQREESSEKQTMNSNFQITSDPNNPDDTNFEQLRRNIQRKSLNHQINDENDLEAIYSPSIEIRNSSGERDEMNFTYQETEGETEIIIEDVEGTIKNKEESNPFGKDLVLGDSGGNEDPLMTQFDKITEIENSEMSKISETNSIYKGRKQSDLQINGQNSGQLFKMTDNYFEFNMEKEEETNQVADQGGSQNPPKEEDQELEEKISNGSFQVENAQEQYKFKEDSVVQNSSFSRENIERMDLEEEKQKPISPKKFESPQKAPAQSSENSDITIQNNFSSYKNSKMNSLAQNEVEEPLESSVQNDLASQQSKEINEDRKAKEEIMDQMAEKYVQLVFQEILGDWSETESKASEREKETILASIVSEISKQTGQENENQQRTESRVEFESGPTEYLTLSEKNVDLILPKKDAVSKEEIKESLELATTKKIQEEESHPLAFTQEKFQKTNSSQVHLVDMIERSEHEKDLEAPLYYLTDSILQTKKSEMLSDLSILERLKERESTRFELENDFITLAMQNSEMTETEEDSEVPTEDSGWEMGDSIPASDLHSDHQSQLSEDDLDLDICSERLHRSKHFSAKDMDMAEIFRLKRQKGDIPVNFEEGLDQSQFVKKADQPQQIEIGRLETSETLKGLEMATNERISQPIDVQIGDSISRDINQIQGKAIVTQSVDLQIKNSEPEMDNFEPKKAEQVSESNDGPQIKSKDVQKKRAPFQDSNASFDKQKILSMEEASLKGLISISGSLDQQFKFQGAGFESKESGSQNKISESSEKVFSKKKNPGEALIWDEKFRLTQTLELASEEGEENSKEVSKKAEIWNGDFSEVRSGSEDNEMEQGEARFVIMESNSIDFHKSDERDEFSGEKEKDFDLGSREKKSTEEGLDELTHYTEDQNKTNISANIDINMQVSKTNNREIQDEESSDKGQEDSDYKFKTDTTEIKSDNKAIDKKDEDIFEEKTDSLFKKSNRSEIYEQFEKEIQKEPNTEMMQEEFGEFSKDIRDSISENIQKAIQKEILKESTREVTQNLMDDQNLNILEMPKKPKSAFAETNLISDRVTLPTSQVPIEFQQGDRSEKDNLKEEFASIRTQEKYKKDYNKQRTVKAGAGHLKEPNDEGKLDAFPADSRKDLRETIRTPKTKRTKTESEIYPLGQDDVEEVVLDEKEKIFKIKEFDVNQVKKITNKDSSFIKSSYMNIKSNESLLNEKKKEKSLLRKDSIPEKKISTASHQISLKFSRQNHSGRFINPIKRQKHSKIRQDFYNFPSSTEKSVVTFVNAFDLDNITESIPINAEVNQIFAKSRGSPHQSHSPTFRTRTTQNSSKRIQTKSFKTHQIPQVSHTTRWLKSDKLVSKAPIVQVRRHVPSPLPVTTSHQPRKVTYIVRSPSPMGRGANQVVRTTKPKGRQYDRRVYQKKPKRKQENFIEKNKKMIRNLSESRRKIKQEQSRSKSKSPLKRASLTPGSMSSIQNVSSEQKSYRDLYNDRITFYTNSLKNKNFVPLGSKPTGSKTSIKKYAKTKFGQKQIYKSEIDRISDNIKRSLSPRVQKKKSNNSPLPQFYRRS